MSWLSRLRNSIHPKRLDRELADLTDEMYYHRSRLAAVYRQKGLSPGEADKQAALRFGNITRLKEECREVRLSTVIENIIQDISFALRTMRKSPMLTFTILFTLALGIGANTAIFTVVYATLLASPPYPNPDRLVNVWSKLQGQCNYVSPGDFIDWKRNSTSFEALNACGTNNFNIATQDRPEFLDGMEATPGYYGMLGVPLFLGRNFLPEEGEPGKERVVILTHRLWQHLGANLKIIGRTMLVNGEPHQVVGVMAAGIADRWDWELIVPLVFKPEQLNDHTSRYRLVTGRLRPGVTIRQAQAEMDAIAAKEAQDYPRSNQGWGALVEPFKNDFLPSSRRWTLWLLLGAVGCLLLITCLNIANLLLAKGITRQREVAIRGALGARPSAVFAQFLTEGIVLSILGGVLGVAAGHAMLGGLVATMPSDTLPAEADLALNVPILLVMLAASTLVGVLFGCAPAWYASRLDSAEVLKEGGRSGIGVGRHGLRRLLVIAEFAVALPLLVGAVLAIHSLWNLTHLDLGVRTDHILGFYIDSVALERNPNQAKVNSYYRRIIDSIETVPGVSRVSAMNYLPLDIFHFAMPFTIAGQPEYANPSLRPNADLQNVTPDYFETFGIRIVKGRTFTDHDDATSIKVAMVNEAFADRFLKGVDPLQQRVITEQLIPGEAEPGPAIERKIVGVFHNVKSRGSREDHPEIDLPFWQEASSVSGIGVRTAQDPATMVKTIAAAVNAVDSQAALALTRTMDQVHDQVLANDRFTVILFVGFAVVGLLLAMVGIYGVIAFSVAQRSPELALRMALGATRNQVLTIVVKEGLVLACAGLGFGLIGAYFVWRAMRSILFGVSAIDFSAFGTVGVTLLLAAVLACYIPALRATKVEMMRFLKSE